MREAFRDIRVRLARLNAYPAGASLRDAGGAALRAGGGAPPQRFADLNREHLEAHLRSITIYAVFFPVVEVLTAVAMALLLWYGGLRVLDGTLTVGVLAAFIQYTRRFFQPLQDLSEKFNLLQSAMASSERVFTLLDEPVTVAEPAVPGTSLRRRARRGAIRGGVVPLQPRRALGPAGHLVHGVARPHDRPGRPHRGGEDHDRQPAAPVLRPGAGPDHGRWSGHPRPLDRSTSRSIIGFVQQDLFLFTGDILHNLTLDAPITADAARDAARRVGADRFIERLPSGYAHGSASGAGASASASGSS